MQFLRNLVESGRKLYHPKDSRFHKLWPMFDAAERLPDHRGPGRRDIRFPRG